MHRVLIDAPFPNFGHRCAHPIHVPLVHSYSMLYVTTLLLAVMFGTTNDGIGMTMMMPVVEMVILSAPGVRSRPYS